MRASFLRFGSLVLLASCSNGTKAPEDAGNDVVTPTDGSTVTPTDGSTVFEGGASTGTCGLPLTGHCYPYLYALCWELEGRPATTSEINEGCVAGGGTWIPDGGCEVSGVAGRCVIHDPDGGVGCSTYFYADAGSNMTECTQEDGTWLSGP